MDQLQLTDEQCKATVQSMLKILVCPVCYELPKGLRLSACIKGHIICSTCRPKVNNCPICRQRFSTEEPHIVKQMIHSLPKICKNPGCSHVLNPGEDHEANCPYQVVTCKLCPSILFMCDAHSHVKRAHEAVALDTNTVKMHFTNTNPMGPVTQVALTYINKQLFWASYRLNKSDMLVSVEMWSSTEQFPEHYMLATLELTDEDGNLFSFTDKLSKKNKYERILIFDFTIPKSTLRSFEDGKNLSLNISIINNNNNNNLTADVNALKMFQ